MSRFDRLLQRQSRLLKKRRYFHLKDGEARELTAAEVEEMLLDQSAHWTIQKPAPKLPGERAPDGEGDA